jgi:EAL domain-containing protein (putative c-di-GMP-specific phosphodiesterase class I)
LRFGADSRGMTNQLPSVPVLAATSMTFQPILRLDDNQIMGYEAAAAPVPAAGSADELFALELALTALDRLDDVTWLGLNVSMRALLDSRVTGMLLAHADRGIAVELPEEYDFTEYAPVVAVTERLRAAGILIAADHAAGGHASLTHILQLSPDFVKLDASLAAGVDIDRSGLALTRSLVDLAHNTGALLIAQGITTPAEHAKLRELGVHLGQGDLLGEQAAQPAPLLLATA